MLSTSHTQAGRRPVKFAVSALTMAILLVSFMATPAQADDLEIYQPATTGGGSTLVLMLDGAGDMNSSGKYDDLVLGMKIFLASDDPTVNKTALGLGHYNNKNDPSGDGSTADIIVPAAKLDSVVPSGTAFGTFGQYVPGVQLYEPADSNPKSQRRLLWNFVVATEAAPVSESGIGVARNSGYAFKGEANTNPMQGFAEAASYLLGTTTTGAVTSAGRKNISGFASSVSTSKVKDLSKYKTPLTSSSGICSGVGIYFLTAGGFQDKTPADGESIFGKALSTAASSTTFTCPTSGTFNNQAGPWSCMGKFAQTLFSGDSPAARANPAAGVRTGVQIRTAFVGFGGEFKTLSSNDRDALDICHIGSKLKGDVCSPDSPTNANPAGGYGNGGYYAVTSPTTVAESVKNFILTLGGDTVTPLVTGAASIPIDTLNPNGFQNYGYLRMIAPNPSKPSTMLWKGDLKKYALSGGALVSNNTTNVYVLNSIGQLNSSTSTPAVPTTDNWNATAGNGVAAGTNDGGIIDQGGAYPKVPMPTTADQNKIRPLFTDVGAVTVVTASTSGTTNTTTGVTADKVVTLSSVANGALLTPVKPLTSASTLAIDLHTTIPQMFDASNSSINNGSPLKNLSIVQKKKLINYLGFNTPIYGADDKPQVAQRVPQLAAYAYIDTSVTPNVTTNVYYSDPVGVPTDLTALPNPPLPASPYLAMGGSIHAQPIQLTYSANADLTGRVESVLYGSMEGALHMVNATTGVEQMAFVPAEILADDIVSRSLKLDAENKSSSSVTDLRTPSQGVDGPWVADAAYGITKTTTGTGTTAVTTSALVASRMNVYGGMRLGGKSYYGLDLSNKNADVVTPKLLFRIGSDVSGFERMGQTFAKPVLANIRLAGTITRVMIVGGGYDTGYESPSFTPSSRTPALGNTVYMVNATTGALIWSALSSNNANLIHSVAARVSAVDRDADGLIDSVYFADLGGQVFRADFSNANSNTASTFPVRVTRLANLATSAAITNGTNPRFFEAPTVTVNDYGLTVFALVTVASGNRSSPLDVLDTSEGGQALRTLPVNNVYGIIDRDLASPNLLQSSYTIVTQDKTLNDLQLNPQALSSSTVIPTVFFPAGTGKKDGWYRSLSSKIDGTDFANGTFRYPGGLKAYEEQIALTGKLYVPVYDPQGTGVSGSTCAARVVGETDLQTYCLPYGVCTILSGTDVNKIDTSKEADSGVKFTNGTNSGSKNSNVIGPGIRGISLGANTPNTSGNACKDFTLVGNQSGTSNWSCNRKLVPTLWYEKQPNRNKVQ